MTDKRQAIIYTRVDEAPALATYSLLPIIRAFTEAAGIEVETADISLAGRILARFPDYLREDQAIPDHLAELERLVHRPEANIIKLPCISASVPQLKAAIGELRGQGFNVPEYPDEPSGEEQQEIRNRYDAVKGSAVNPVLRQGNSDRRLPPAVKQFARRHPHAMGAWPPDSRSHVSHMTSGDMRGNEVSTTIAAETAGPARIEFTPRGGGRTVLAEGLEVENGEIVDATVMSSAALRDFLEREIEDARQKDVLFSVHLKATMMKVSDPVIFGRVIAVFFRDVFEKHGRTLDGLGVDPAQGLGELHTRLQNLPAARREAINADIQACLERGPRLAMVDSDRGISNLHVPSDVIIDASMPAAIRNSGRMWGPDGELHDTKFVIPDSTYAGVYRAVLDDCREHGAFDPRTMGDIPNVGLMAGRAEEYGSHDTTFVMPAAGDVRLLSEAGKVLLERPVESGDIFRLCRTGDEAVRDWVKLAARRAREDGIPFVFWLDEDRPHDARLLRKVHRYLDEEDTEGLECRVLKPEAACRFSLARMRRGEDTLSVTGNVLRDYLTDLFPILEAGTSARMLSIVPLLAGGALFETGAGGSAPKHVQQFLAEGHLRWDSLGEYLALAASLSHSARTTGNERAGILAETLDLATGEFMENNRSPSRKVNEIDTRGSHFYLALYWARAMAADSRESRLRQRFRELADELSRCEDCIGEELLAVQGRETDPGGYYRPDDTAAESLMRPSKTFNEALEMFRRR